MVGRMPAYILLDGAQASPAGWGQRDPWGPARNSTMSSHLQRAAAGGGVAYILLL